MRISDWSSDVCSSDLLEIKRMTAAGGLDEIAEENVTAAERTALDMIVFSPRRVTLPPNQPQVVRVGVRVPEGLPPGEYRAHMLFRAVPDVVPAVAAEAKPAGAGVSRSEEHTSELQSLMRHSYAVFCLNKKT